MLGLIYAPGLGFCQFVEVGVRIHEPRQQQRAPKVDPLDLMMCGGLSRRSDRRDPTIGDLDIAKHFADVVGFSAFVTDRSIFRIYGGARGLNEHATSRMVDR